MMKACDLYSRTSRGQGNREYWVGYMGGVKVLVFEVNNPTEEGASHTMFYAERKPRQEPPSRAAEPGVATGEALAGRAREWSPSERDRHEQELADRFDARPVDDVPF